MKGDKNEEPREEISKGRAGVKGSENGKMLPQRVTLSRTPPSNAHSALVISREPADIVQLCEETSLCPEKGKAAEWKQALQFPGCFSLSAFSSWC